MAEVTETTTTTTEVLGVPATTTIVEETTGPIHTAYVPWDTLLESPATASLHENKKHYQMIVNAPKMDNVNVHVENDMLTVTGSQAASSTPTTDPEWRQATSFKEFKRTTRLPRSVDQSNIKAMRIDENTVHIILPKPHKIIPRHPKKDIPVTSSGVTSA